MSLQFKDYFSSHAEIYAQHRPAYPAALFRYLSELGVHHDTVWDCGTGNGQVAIGLTPYFQKILATDASPQQLAQAIAHPQIEYRVATAEHSTLLDQSVDLITVGLALHWFNFDLFYQEVRRVLNPTGAIAVWCYSDVELPTASAALLAQLTQFRRLIYPYFAPEIGYIWARYATIPFPFVERPTPEFTIQAQWQAADLIGYLQSLSGTQRFREQQGADALNAIAQGMLTAWGAADTLPAQWTIHLRVGQL